MAPQYTAKMRTFMAVHPSPEGGTTLTKDHPAILRIYDVGIWDSPHSKFEPILLGCFGEKNCFCVFWPFLVFLGVIFTQPCCFRVFLALHMPSTPPSHLPDTLRHHPDTAIHPQTPSRHPSDTPLHATTGRKSNI